MWVKFLLTRYIAYAIIQTMKLAEHMKKNGLSQLEVARRTGVSQATLSLYLSGKRGLSLDSALRISAALGIPVEDLRPREEESSDSEDV
jgi:transcriptional regulator with XRE-family HTH domain